MVSQQLLDFLKNSQPFEYNGHQHHSSLVLALKECRKATKRNEETGLYDENLNFGYPGNWLGAIGYMSVLDLIGSAFKNSNAQNKEELANSIKYAIKSFAYDFIGRNNGKLKAIIGLRNAFTHDFNLLYINRFNPAERYKYAVDWKDNNDVLTLPETPWDGDILNKNFDETRDRTNVNLLALGNMVEEIFRRIKVGINDGSITTQLDEVTIIKKYTFRTFESQMYE